MLLNLFQTCMLTYKLLQNMLTCQLPVCILLTNILASYCFLRTCFLFYYNLYFSLQTQFSMSTQSDINWTIAYNTCFDKFDRKFSTITSEAIRLTGNFFLICLHNFPLFHIYFYTEKFPISVHTHMAPWNRDSGCLISSIICILCIYSHT